MGKVFTDYQMMVAVEGELYKNFANKAEEVDVLNFIGDKIFFDVKMNDEWHSGYVKVDASTDLGVYVQDDPGVVDYSYQFDILWDDILPEEAE